MPVSLLLLLLLLLLKLQSIRSLDQRWNKKHLPEMSLASLICNPLMEISKHSDPFTWA